MLRGKKWSIWCFINWISPTHECHSCYIHFKHSQLTIRWTRGTSLYSVWPCFCKALDITQHIVQLRDVSKPSNEPNIQRKAKSRKLCSSLSYKDVIKIHGMRKIHGAFQKTLPIKRYVVMAETPPPPKIHETDDCGYILRMTLNAVDLSNSLNRAGA